MKVVRFFMIPSISIVSAGCSSDDIIRSDVVGLYQSNYASAVETLEINRDGRFVHMFLPQKGSGFTNTGSWSFYSANGDTRIIFSSFRFTDRRQGASVESEKERAWPAIVERRNRTITIPINVDAGLSYRFAMIDAY